MLIASGAAGVNVTLRSSAATVSVVFTSVAPADSRIAAAVTVARFMASLKVTTTTADVSTAVVPLAGVTAATAGATTSCTLTVTDGDKPWLPAASRADPFSVSCPPATGSSAKVIVNSSDEEASGGLMARVVVVVRRPVVARPISATPTASVASTDTASGTRGSIEASAAGLTIVTTGAVASRTVTVRVASALALPATSKACTVRITDPAGVPATVGTTNVACAGVRAGEIGRVSSKVTAPRARNTICATPTSSRPVACTVIAWPGMITAPSAG